MNEADEHCEGTEVLPDQFRAELEVFSGPLDLLLHLIRQEEIDILEIPLAHITDQYLRVLRAMQGFDVNVAAEFLVMAATLMEIKSRTLLPESHLEDEEEPDPGDDLVRRLLQYKRFKEAAALLAGLAQERQKRFARMPLPQSVQPEPVSVEKLLEDVSIWDVVSAYLEVVRQIEMAQVRHIVYDEVPVKAYMEELMAALDGGGGQVGFLDLLARDRSRGRVIGMFLALLELARQGRIAVGQQEGDRSQIGIALAGGDPGAVRQ